MRVLTQIRAEMSIFSSWSGRLQMERGDLPPAGATCCHVSRVVTDMSSAAVDHVPHQDQDQDDVRNPADVRCSRCNCLLLRAGHGVLVQEDVSHLQTGSQCHSCFPCTGRSAENGRHCGCGSRGHGTSDQFLDGGRHFHVRKHGLQSHSGEPEVFGLRRVRVRADRIPQPVIETLLFVGRPCHCSC